MPLTFTIASLRTCEVYRLEECLKAITGALGRVPAEDEPLDYGWLGSTKVSMTAWAEALEACSSPEKADVAVAFSRLCADRALVHADRVEADPDGYPKWDVRHLATNADDCAGEARSDAEHAVSWAKLIPARHKVVVYKGYIARSGYKGHISSDSLEDIEEVLESIQNATTSALSAASLAVDTARCAARTTPENVARAAAFGPRYDVSRFWDDAGADEEAMQRADMHRLVGSTPPTKTPPADGQRKFAMPENTWGMGAPPAPTAEEWAAHVAAKFGGPPAAVPTEVWFASGRASAMVPVGTVVVTDSEEMWLFAYAADRTVLGAWAAVINDSEARAVAVPVGLENEPEYAVGANRAVGERYASGPRDVST